MRTLDGSCDITIVFFFAEKGAYGAPTVSPFVAALAQESNYPRPME
jgi:hypothetical protein